MTKPVARCLRQIENLLLKGNQDAGDLWEILAALRGPDEDHGNVNTFDQKVAFTVPIRRQAFPRLARVDNLYLAVTMNHPLSPRRVKVTDRSFPAGHFEAHIYSAQVALSRRAPSARSPRKAPSRRPKP